MLFRKNLPSSCLYCVHGAAVSQDRVVCAKKGLVDAGNPCRRFQYDPLKRVPPRRKAMDFSRYDQDDFSL